MYNKKEDKSCNECGQNDRIPECCFCEPLEQSLFIYFKDSHCSRDKKNDNDTRFDNF